MLFRTEHDGGLEVINTYYNYSGNPINADREQCAADTCGSYWDGAFGGVVPVPASRDSVEETAAQESHDDNVAESFLEDVEDVGSSSTSLPSEAPALDLQLVDQINSDPASTWVATADVPRFEATSLSQMRSLLKASTYGIEDLPKKENPTPEFLAALPDSFDPRQDQDRMGCQGPVLDQGWCGSCWAFAAAEAMSDRLCIHKKKKDPNNAASFLQLAPLDLTSCDSSSCGGQMGCQGGQVSQAWDWGQTNGLVSDKCLPYLKSHGGPVPTCAPEEQPCLPESKFIQPPPCPTECIDGSSYEGDKHLLKTAYSIPGEDQMKAEIVNYGSIEGVYHVYTDFLLYKTGVYSYHNGTSLGYHGIKIFGYGTEGDLPYWWVQNSWTTTWGDGGYFKIKRGVNECGIEEQAVAGEF